MKKVFVLCIIAFTITACGNSNSNENSKDSSDGTKETPIATEPGDETSTYDPKRGEGKFTQVDINPSLDAGKADSGEKVYSAKCSSCHKLTDEKLVGPGWKDVTSRHTAEWIMNFSTNPDEMINKDPKAQAMLELCLVRMPNQNLSDEDPRNVYEFMRKNDGVK